MSKYPYVRQLESVECGICCLSMIFAYHGHYDTITELRKEVLLRDEGLRLEELKKIATVWGFRTLAGKITPQNLPLIDNPCIILIDGNHFVVIYQVKKNTVIIGDPETGIEVIKIELFLKRVNQSDVDGDDIFGFALLLEPTSDFYNTKKENKKSKVRKLEVYSYIKDYLKPYKKHLKLIVVSLLLSISLQIVQPFLTQSIVDVGISAKDFAFLKLVLFAQLFLLISGFGINLIRTYLLSHISMKVNISQLFDFLSKLQKLPSSFFERFKVSDLIRRIDDHGEIESFIMGNLFSIIFDIASILVLMVVLLSYNINIFLIYLLGTVLYNIWILYFIKKRRQLNHECFNTIVKTNDSIYEMTEGMNYIKLYNYGEKKLWKWVGLQNELIRQKIKYMWNYQFSGIGTLFLSRFKDLVILYVAATLVVNREMTIGVLMAIQSIIGQLNNPINNLLGFYNVLMETGVSIERIKIITDKSCTEEFPRVNVSQLGDLKVENVSYKYSKYDNNIIHNITLQIPENRMTVIVGQSGCGKTTLLKLLLRFYEEYEGSITVGNSELSNISSENWDEFYSVSMQDSYTFSETILENIIMGYELDMSRLEMIAKLTCFDTVIHELPKGYLTTLGKKGIGLSKGQLQRMLLTRCLYKKSKYIFLDEATNALDPLTERVVVGNLKNSFSEQTILFITHNLENVKLADQIIVMDKGHIIETGNFEELMGNKGLLYTMYNANSSLISVHNS